MLNKNITASRFAAAAMALSAWPVGAAAQQIPNPRPYVYHQGIVTNTIGSNNQAQPYEPEFRSLPMQPGDLRPVIDPQSILAEDFICPIKGITTPNYEASIVTDKKEIFNAKVTFYRDGTYLMNIIGLKPMRYNFTDMLKVQAQAFTYGISATLLKDRQHVSATPTSGFLTEQGLKNLNLIIREFERMLKPEAIQQACASSSPGKHLVYRTNGTEIATVDRVDKIVAFNHFTSPATGQNYDLGNFIAQVTLDQESKTYVTIDGITPDNHRIHAYVEMAGISNAIAPGNLSDNIFPGWIVPDNQRSNYKYLFDIAQQASGSKMVSSLPFLSKRPTPQTAGTTTSVVSPNP